MNVLMVHTFSFGASNEYIPFFSAMVLLVIKACVNVHACISIHLYSLPQDTNKHVQHKVDQLSQDVDDVQRGLSKIQVHRQ